MNENDDLGQEINASFVEEIEAAPPPAHRDVAQATEALRDKGHQMVRILDTAGGNAASNPALQERIHEVLWELQLTYVNFLHAIREEKSDE